MKVPQVRVGHPAATAGAKGVGTGGISQYFTVGNVLAMVSLTVPVVVASFRARVVYSNFKAKFFPNVVNFQLHSIRRVRVSTLHSHAQTLSSVAATGTAASASSLSVATTQLQAPVLTVSPQDKTLNSHQNYKYELFSKTLHETDISNVIYNDTGIKLLQRASRKCTFEEPFITMSDRYTYNFFCNAMQIKLHQQFAGSWMLRDQNINKMLFGSDGSVSNFESQKYVCAMLSTLGEKRHVSRFSSKPFYLGKIRVFLVQEQFILDILEQFGSTIHDMTENEWNEFLQPDGIDVEFEDCDLRMFNHRTKWNLIRQVVKKYDLQEKTENGELTWANPLFRVEIPSLAVKDANGWQRNLSKVVSTTVDCAPQKPSAKMTNRAAARQRRRRKRVQAKQLTCEANLS